MRPDNRDDPLLWINRAKNGYMQARESLVVKGEAPGERVPAKISEISLIRKGILITLYRYASQGDEHLLIPVSRDEAAGWNVPLNIIFRDAIGNTSALFPPRIFNLKTSEYIDYRPDPLYMYDYEHREPAAVAAEDPAIYSTEPAGSGPGLRLIVTTSPLIGDTALLYPNLLMDLGRMAERDPTILICGPGKFFVFSGKDESLIESYVKKYRERFDDGSPEIRTYKYFRKNRVILDNSPEEKNKISILPKTPNIPRGSVASAWGDIETRNKLLDWKKGLGKGNKPFT